MKNNCWSVVCGDNKHVISLNRGVNVRDPMSLVVDGKIIANLVIPSSSFVAKLEHSFECDGESMKIVVFGNKADLVYQGIYQGSKKAYTSDYELNVWLKIVFVLANIVPVFLNFGSYTSVIMPLACIALSWACSVTPLTSKKDKILRLTLILLLNLLVMAMGMISGI